MSYNFNRGGGRFYGGPPPGQPSIRIGGPLTPVLKIFIIANVAVYVLMMLLTQKGQHQFMNAFGLVPYDFWHLGRIWQLATFNFLHSGLGHLFFNMLALYFFAGDLEQRFGKRRFILFLAVAGIGAGLTMLITSPGMQIPVVGASGIVYGILLAYGVNYPNRVVYLYFLFPIRVKYLVLIFGGIELLASIAQTQSGVAHLAHLGGMVFGGLYLYYDKIYMKMRDSYYRQKLKNLKKKYEVYSNTGKDDDGPTYH